MALFKINHGGEANLPKDKKDGFAYVTYDKNAMFIDVKKRTGTDSKGQPVFASETSRIKLYDYLEDRILNVSGSPGKLAYYNTDGSLAPLTSSLGSATQPVYFTGGKPTACTYTLAKSVPADAKFTDTNTWRPVVDALDSTVATSSLSANQGNVLNTKIEKSLLPRTTQITTSTDWNTITTPGYYKVAVATWGDASKLNSPNVYKSDLYAYGLLIVYTIDTMITQIYIPHYTNASSPILERMSYSSSNNPVWIDWAEIGRGTSWANILNKPTTFTPTAHTHSVNNTIVASSATATANTTAALTDGNVFLNHIENSTVKNSHKLVGSGGLTVTSDASGNLTFSGAAATHNHTIAQVTGLSDALAKKSDSGHTHTIGQVTNLQTTLDDKAAKSHTHAISEITDLQTTLDGKAAKSHSHSYLPLSGGTMAGSITMGNIDKSDGPTLIFKSKERNFVWMGYANGAGTFYLYDTANSKSILYSTANGQSYFQGQLFDSYHKIWSDSEGGNIRLMSASDTKDVFEFDRCYEKKLRLYSSKDGGNNLVSEFIFTQDGDFSASKVYGAVWNDYAEFRGGKEDIKPGYCVISNDDGIVQKTTKKFQACDGIVSDTFGFAIGETDECKIPLAVAGRVLAYCAGDRSNYHAGDTVCAGPEGKVVKMTREEVREWPDRIVGIVSEIPDYETWGTGNVKVDGRIWIKVK